MQIHKSFSMCKRFLSAIRVSGSFSDTLILKHLKQNHYPIFQIMWYFHRRWHEGGGRGESGDIFTKRTSPLHILNYELNYKLKQVETSHHTNTRKQLSHKTVTTECFRTKNTGRKIFLFNAIQLSVVLFCQIQIGFYFFVSFAIYTFTWQHFELLAHWLLVSSNPEHFCDFLLVYFRILFHYF